MRHFAAAAVVLVLLAGCGGGGEVVVVYSPHGTDVLGDYEQLFEAAHPGVDVQWLDMGSGEVLSRVRAEQNRPAADVWWGAPSTMFAQAAKEGLLAPYRPTWADQVEAAFHDPEGRWYATHRSPLCILYNTRGYAAEDVPQAWDELLAPRWNGLVSLREPLASGTMRTFLCAMVDRAPSDDAGIDWLRRLHTSTSDYLENPNLLFDHLKKNEDHVSVWLMPDVVLQRDRNGYPFGYHVPSPAPVVTEGIAVVANAPHPELARAFYEFVTTAEALTQQARAYAKLPAREDIDRAALPAELTEQDYTPMAIDWDRFAEKEREWCARWEKEVYAAP